MLSTIYYSITNPVWAASQPLWQTVVSLNNTKWNFLFIVCVYLVLKNFFIKHYCACSLIITYSILSKYSQIDCVPQLLVGYNNVHPLLFYSAAILLYTLTTPAETLGKISNLTVFIIGACSLILGGYWGLNNTAWGYFWVNDFIELILLTICVLALIRSHQRNYLMSQLYGCVSLFYIIALIIGSRHGLVFTRHSFFDLTKITSVSILYPLSVCKVHYLAVLKILPLVISCTLFLLLVQAIKTISLQAFQKLHLLFLHMITAVLFITWLKQAPLHYSIAVIKQMYLAVPVFLNKSMVAAMFQFSKYKTTVYLITNTLFLHKKVYILKHFAVVLFSSFIFFIFLLLSIVKIYDNYVQN